MKCYNFYSYPSKEDMNILKNIAMQIRDEKNIISQYICDNRNILEEIYDNKNTLYLINRFKHLRTTTAVIHQQLCKDVITNYKQCFSSLTYPSKKDEENVDVKKYIMKFGLIAKDNFLALMQKYLKNNEQDDEHDDVFIQKVIELVETSDIFEEVRSYVNKCLDYRQEHPVNFKSLTFSSINVLNKKQKMLYEDHDAKTNAIYVLNLPKVKQFLLKTRLNKTYHGDINSFISKPSGVQHRMSYQIKFMNNKRIKLILNKESKEPQKKKNNKKIIGIDVNTKHNMFSFNDGHIIRYDNKLIYKEKGLRKYLARMAKNKALHHNKEKQHGRKIKLREEKHERRRKFHQDLKSSLAVKYAVKQKKNHIVMEDVNLRELKGVKLTSNKNHKGLNFNHIKDAIHINDLKNSVQRIAERKGLQFSLVNARYTSQTCPKCVHIHEDNRRTQEDFVCQSCGFTANADHVAALNIALRMAISALKKKFQYFDKDKQIYVGFKYKDIEKFTEIYKEAYNNRMAVKAIKAFIVRNSMEKAECKHSVA